MFCPLCKAPRTGPTCSVCGEPSCKRCGIEFKAMQGTNDRPSVNISAGQVCVGGCKCHFDFKVRLGEITPVGQR